MLGDWSAASFLMYLLRYRKTMRNRLSSLARKCVAVIRDTNTVLGLLVSSAFALDLPECATAAMASNLY